MSIQPYYERDGIVLYNADCLEHTDLWTCADVLVSDPPYGMGYASNMSGAFKGVEIAGDDTPEARDRALEAWSGPALVFGRWSVPRPAGARMLLTWDKSDGAGLGMGDLSIPWGLTTEEIYVIGTGFTGRRTNSVLRVPKPPSSVERGRVHPTEKPVPLMRALIEKCPPGAVADPFAGSGSTLVACAELGRSAIGFELEERYCEIAARRISDALDQGSLFGFGEAA